MEIDYFCDMKCDKDSGSKIIMVGAGGHALSIAEFAGDRIYGYLSQDPNPEMPGKWIGTDEERRHLAEEGCLFHMGYVYSGLPRMEKRRLLIEAYKTSGARFMTIISPTATVTPRSRIGEGCTIMTGAIVNRAVLGENVVVNSGAIVEHDCEVGDNTFIGPGVVIGGFTRIGSNCFIGLGARIMNGVTIGDNVSVAMGAIVNKSLLEPGLYHGSPLKRFKDV